MCEREKHTMYSGGTLSLSFSGILTSVIAFKRPVLNDSSTAQASLPSGFICNSHPSLWSGNSDRASSGLLSRCKKCPPHKDLDTICKPCNCSHQKKTCIQNHSKTLMIFCLTNWVMWLKQCHKPPMGNGEFGKHTTYIWWIWGWGDLVISCIGLIGSAETGIHPQTTGLV